MSCPNCGAEIPDGTKYCGQCGRAPARSESPVNVPLPGADAIPRASLPVASALDLRFVLAIGFVGGGFIGFLMRPSVFLVGQLPFVTVVTRGSGLSGIDQLLIPSAQQSFNVMVAGALVGAAVAFAASRSLAKSRA